MSVHEREEAVVARLHGLAPHLDGEPDPAFRAATRARLVAMAAVRTPEPAPAGGMQRLLAVRAPDVRPARWRSRFTAGLAGAALTVTALAGLVAVADGARPGDVLYDLKRGTEQTQLALAGDARGRTLLDFASTRLDEVEALVGEGGTALPVAPVEPAGDGVSAAGADPALVLETLRTMDEQTSEGASWLADRAVDTQDGEPLDELAEWAAVQSAELAALQPRMPGETTEAVGRSLTLLAEIGARTGGLQAAVACPGGPAVSGTDDLGPVPAPCPAPDPAPPVTTTGESPGPSTQAGTGTTPPAPTAPAAPTPTPVPVPGTTPGGGLPTTPAPTTPGGGLLPPLPLPPLPGGGSSASTPPPIIQVPGPVTLCLPPLATLGNC
ncbi:DUF5667 domain-containing protein [Blastococcus litoris]|uniref:DUF5667 domain-containing protein n=1 Tax=Blastococcus litoris TaxID=2171622 RepID=UPI000E308B59|nr:DUF5667 domain-containing protein [Blastococcus litoris]